MQTTSHLWRRLLLLGTILLGSGSAFAGNDHEQARQLREAGEILPLETILSQVRARGNTGHVLEVELKNKHGRYVYEIEMLDAHGRVQESILDARTGKPLDAKRVDD